jgi:hypothetical protein
MLKLLILFTRLLLVFPLFGFSQTQKRKIIDVHFHARYFDDYGFPPPANPLTGMIPQYKTNDELRDLTFATLKKNNIVKVICAGNLKRVNDYKIVDSAMVISSLEYPDWQNTPLPDTATFIRLFKEKKFSVFGELGLQYEGKTLADPELQPYLAICERLAIPITLHTGQSAPNTPYKKCCPNFTISSGKPLTVEEVLKKHPKLKIQMMHMEHPFLEEMKAIMNVYPQVYVDISPYNWVFPVEEFYSYLKPLIIAGFGKRIMYGSDQGAWPEVIPISIKNVEKAPFLTEAQKQDIFYNNAARFYGIK